MLLPQQMFGDKSAPSTTDVKKICNILLQTLKNLHFLQHNARFLFLLVDSLNVAFPVYFVVEMKIHLPVVFY